MLGMTHWRTEHPKATRAGIDVTGDERMNQVWAHRIQDLVQMGESQEWNEIPEVERSRCATCGKPLSARGKQTRFLYTTGGKADTHRWDLPQCGGGFFPPDEE